MNVDRSEIHKFESSAARWWDPNSEFKPLHQLNPLRLNYVQKQAGGLKNKTVLDVGCGGGLLSEAMARSGAQVTGIDLGAANLEVAELHLLESGLKVDYQKIAVETLAKQKPAFFDVITCMEMLEHVPDPFSVVQACAQLLKPGGVAVFSTLNRHPKSYLMAIIGAEYILNLLPKGTHQYNRFIQPAELGRWLRQSGLQIKNACGVQYHLLSDQYRLAPHDLSVNYLISAVKYESID